MKLAQIVDGIVVNVAVVDPDARPDFTATWPEAGDAGPGWSYNGTEFAPPTSPAPTPAAVTAERDRRLSAGFDFASTRFDSDGVSLQRITGAATLAGFAVMAGAMSGDLRWHGSAADFVWIAADNSLVPMDAQTCFAFGQAAAAHQSRMIFAAKALKSTTPIPTGFADDSYWH